MLLKSTEHFTPQPDSFWSDVDSIVTKMTYQDLKTLHDKVADQIAAVRDLDVFLVKDQLHVGDTVSFTYDGNIIIGVVAKKNPKTFYIRTPDQRLWKVPPLALSLPHT
jgi:hypothetical protein